MTLKSDRIPADVAEAVYGEDWLEMSAVVKMAEPSIAGNASVRPPGEDAFSEAGVEFLESVALRAIAERLIERHERFRHLHDLGLLIGWKAEGGTSGGRPRLGQCMKPNWLARQYSDADFVIWLAADYIRQISDWGEREIEALLYHELCHAGINDKGKPVIIAHQFEGFFSDLDHYGDVLPQWQAIGDVFNQQRLPGVE